MRINVVSDLHFEFHRDGGKSFVASLPRDIDVLVVAGDLTNAAGLQDALELLCNSTEHLIFVSGNHEFYGSSVLNVLKKLKDLARKHKNLYWLDESEVTLHGQRFIGSTLWFNDNPSALPYRSQMNDFSQIKGLVPWVFDKNHKAVKYLRENIKSGDIVVTHYLPSYRSVPEQYKSSPLNPFFVCDISPVVIKTKAKLWIHGHTHSSCDYMLGETRVVCNPFGYAGQEENRHFDPNMIIEV